MLEKIHVICTQEILPDRMSDFSLAQIDWYNCFYCDKRSECSNHGRLITLVGDNYEANDLCITNNSSVLFGKIYLYESKELVTQEIW